MKYLFAALLVCAVGAQGARGMQDLRNAALVDVAGATIVPAMDTAKNPQLDELKVIAKYRYPRGFGGRFSWYDYYVNPWRGRWVVTDKYSSLDNNNFHPKIDFVVNRWIGTHFVRGGVR